MTRSLWTAGKMTSGEMLREIAALEEQAHESHFWISWISLEVEDAPCSKLWMEDWSQCINIYIYSSKFSVVFSCCSTDFSCLVDDPIISDVFLYFPWKKNSFPHFHHEIQDFFPEIPTFHTMPCLPRRTTWNATGSAWWARCAAAWNALRSGVRI